MNARISGAICVRALVLLMLAGIAGLFNSCVTNPATGDKEFSLLSREDEIALGQQADAEIVAQYGLYDDQAVARYIDSLGQAIAARSDDPTLVWTFRVLDSPVINAFALPGGYVYVTRGLLAHLENEAQLAVVLGHECGHVTARHTARRYTSSQLVSIGVGVGAIVFEDIQPFLGEIQVGLQLLFLKYSRDDESQADELGVKYASKLGYKSEEGSKFFTTLRRIQEKEGGAIPTWASTHPDPADREQKIIEHAQKYRQQFPVQTPIGDNPEAFVPRFNGIVFGDDPRNGFVESGTFYHPNLRFQFQVPSGWALANLNTQVQMVPNVEQPDAAIVLTATEAADPQAVANAFVTEAEAQVLESGGVTVNGLAAYRLVSRVQTEDGAVLQALSYFIRKTTPEGTLVFILHGYSTQARYGAYASTFQSVASSFAEVTNGAVLARNPYRLEVFKAPRSDRFDALVQANSGANVTLLDLAIMNQREVSEQVAAGTSLKQVR